MDQGLFQGKVRKKSAPSFYTASTSTSVWYVRLLFDPSPIHVTTARPLCHFRVLSYGSARQAKQDYSTSHPSLS